MSPEPSRTIVTFHAHPDDESILTGGVMAKAAARGHRVVLVVATRGEEGEVAEGVLAEGELLADRRVEETHRAAEVLGVSRVEFLGYRDSGMMGTPTNDNPACFWQADVEDAAAKLAAILRQEDADVLTVYDEHGGYGHPDHVRVHRVGTRAAVLAGTPRVYEATHDRDYVRSLMETATDFDLDDVGDLDVESMGMPGECITTRVDVADFVAAKRAAMRAHATQIAEHSFFLAMSDDLFALSFGLEWFIRQGAPPGTSETDLLAGL